MPKKKVELRFTPEKANEPVAYALVKEFDLKFNILKAEVKVDGGQLLIEVEGTPAQLSKGVAYLQDMGVLVRELNEFVTKDDTRCTHCGACVSICPAEAMELDRGTWKVEFRSDRCIACGMCITACPPGAMRLKV
ncbi:NIL domain-containing protein [Methanomassiliicoccus luminyensis]|jgi:ferredoxin|uniref:NIL domain-containing protein n=1 Tax=Methanomassiliicoccus luminyensis TaxID=1080712 RepID=UPI0003798CA3|nr:NIL domain-containing protein [Methanomassiliicoccus luminyensis]